MTEFHMQYVPHSLVAAYAALGWIDLGDTPGHHGIYARTMKWIGEGEPPKPSTTHAGDSLKAAADGNENVQERK